jgi:hypothetical protein
VNRRGFSRSLLAGALTCVLALLASRGAAADTHRPRVGYIGSRFQPADPDFQDKLDAGIAHGIGATSVLYVPLSASDLPRKNGEVCATEECLKAAAARQLVDYFVLADVRSGTSHGVPSYQVSLQLIQPVPFEVPLVAELKCEPCIPESLAEKADLAASRLMADLIHSRETPTIVHTKSGGAEAPGGTLVASPGGAPEPSWLSRRWPWILTGAGAAAAITGAVLIFGVGNRSACDGVPGGKCGSTNDYRPPGWAAGSAGVAALLLGGVFVVRGRF